MPLRRSLVPGLWLVGVTGCGLVHFEPMDAGGVDAGRLDAASDAGTPDGGEGDASPGDGGDRDAGGLDAGPMDAGEPDAGEPDAGPPDGGPSDAGPCGACPTGRVCNEELIRCVADPLSVVEIPGERFTMGDGRFADNPAHEVTLSAYRIDRFEVTAGRYDECVRAGRCPNIRGSNPECNYDQSRLDAPMNCVPWNVAVTFCLWAGGRLPTEAEWEHAARGTDGRIFPWGSTPPACDLAVYFDCGEPIWGAGAAYPLPIGSVPMGASPFGVEDMAGNAWEWCSDFYAADGYTPCLGGGCTDPTGPATGTDRVSRGGGHFASDTRDPIVYPLIVLRSVLRDGASPGGGFVDIGFRCAYDP